MENLIACRPSSYGRYFGPKAYEHLKAIGVTSLEVNLAPGNERQQVDELQANGLEVVNACLPLKLDADEDVAELTRGLETVSSLGIKRVFTSAKVSPETPKEEAYRRLRAMAEAAAELDVIILIETHEPIGHNSKVVKETMLAVDHPNVRSNFDTANIYYYNENIDGVEELRATAQWVEGVHLKDTDGGYHSPNFPALGEGIVDFKTSFEILNERGFYGPFTMELEGRADSEDAYFERVAKSVQHLKDIGVI